MGFCKICTWRKRPGRNIKIVVNLKKDTVCPSCTKQFEIKAHKRRKDKKLVIFISRINYSVRPNRYGGTRRLLLPLCRESHGKPKEAGWLDLEIDGGDNLGCAGRGPHFNMDVGQPILSSRCDGVL